MAAGAKLQEIKQFLTIDLGDSIDEAWMQSLDIEAEVTKPKICYISIDNGFPIK